MEVIGNLSAEQIDGLETYIAKNTSEYSPAISPHQLEMQSSCFSKVDNGGIGSYAVFGGNGFTSYAYYKAKNEKIYVIISFMGELTGYSV